MKKDINTLSHRQLRDRLIRHGIPVKQWGKGSEYSFSTLHSSMINRQVRLECKSKHILIHTYTSAVYVLFMDPETETWYRLQNECLEIEKGRQKPHTSSKCFVMAIHESDSISNRVNQKLSYELGKIEPGFKDPKQYLLVPNIYTIVQNPRPHNAWTGLHLVCHQHFSACYIPEDLYRKEYRSDDKFLFKWKKVHSG